MTEDDKIAMRRARMWAAVGNAISTWVLMEGGLVWLLATLLRIDAYPEKAGVLLYSINNFPTWLTIIDELMALDTKLSDHRSKWNKLDSRLRAVGVPKTVRYADSRAKVDHTSPRYRDPTRGKPYGGTKKKRAAKDDPSATRVH